MLESVNIDSFRGINKTDGPVNLSDFTLILGRNNAGKSSFLEAIYLIFGGSGRVHNGKKIKYVKDDRGGTNLAYRYSGEAEVNFKMKGTHGKTIISSNIKVEKFGNMGHKNRPSQSDLSNHGIEIEDTNDITMLIRSGKQESAQMLEYLRKRREQIEKANGHIRAAELINECIGDQYSEIYLETLEARKNPPNRDPYYVKIKDLGTGIARMIPIFLAVETYEPKILLWDDIASSLHPSLMRTVLEWLNEKDIQIIASTHSIDVLSTVLDVMPDGGSVLQFSKSNDDILSHNSLTLDELEILMDSAGLDPRFLSEEFEL